VASHAITKMPDYFINIITDYKIIIFAIMTPFVALIPDLCHKFLKKNYYLDEVEIIKKIENYYE